MQNNPDVASSTLVVTIFCFSFLFFFRQECGMRANSGTNISNMAMTGVFQSWTVILRISQYESTGIVLLLFLQRLETSYLRCET